MCLTVVVWICASLSFDSRVALASEMASEPPARLPACFWLFSLYTQSVLLVFFFLFFLVSGKKTSTLANLNDAALCWWCLCAASTAEQHHHHHHHHHHSSAPLAGLCALNYLPNVPKTRSVRARARQGEGAEEGWEEKEKKEEKVKEKSAQ